ncbi:MAG TPA: hypothetical protein PLD20_29455 [Blastocatellia bacterium]|nr:hypothetical protein [Blastocatellia bacterium]HMX27642.1 hypothetical protein [Blastocatellia bacterium]HMZ22096.1 hypothetical protein [Blastocatellia bacterium]HNG31078.1 hypothetical protein [Blastocatellia bacterium]
MKNKASIFSSLLVLALTMLVSVSAQAQTFHAIDISGPVTAYKMADCGQNGLITIDGVPIVIAAGVDLAFIDGGVTAVDGSGIIRTNQISRSETYQVIGSGRRFRAYLDSNGRIRQWVTVTTPTTSRALIITGIVNAKSADSITINNLTFKIAAGTTVNATADANKIVRLSGTFNSSNELSGTVAVTDDPFVKAKICASPFSQSGGNLVNSLTVDQPILTNPLYLQGPNVFTSTGLSVCDQSVGSVLFGFVNTPIAANFRIPAPETIDQQVYGCYEFSFDQTGWIVGIKKLTTAELPTGVAAQIATGQKPEVVCGSVANFTPAPEFTTPTSLSETAQRGSLRIGVPGNGSFNFTIGARQKLTNQELLTVGAKVCVTPVYEPAGPSATPLLPGEPSPVRLFQLMNGTKVTLEP